ncbi:alpha/beta fold hydrolase [Roseomonas terrae]|uniref:Alpha/beta fold hydrolase n=2 Tax=Neoroseomonas terrae TaxID=424799 RepID=A0ABS5EQ09_9PROT|nr:alpha/beta fold hydrolase [Neoroseomonas terrae]MBR0653118.1 alpha/beta fold hydrolase [Neoroseomonas terrae]
MTPMPLLLLPGLLCDARLWRDQAAALAPIAAPVVADLTLDDRIEAMAERALASLEGPFALAGLSMGGYVALEVMRRAPGRVTRLALLDTSARPDTEEQKRRRRGLISLSRSGQFRGVTPRLLPSLIHPSRLDGPVADDVMAMAERVGKEAFLRQQEAIMNRVDSRPGLSQIAVPTLVGVGAADVLTPPELAAEMAALIPGARLRHFAGTGHLPTMETPEAVNATLAAWLVA